MLQRPAQHLQLMDMSNHTMQCTGRKLLLLTAALTCHVPLQSQTSAQTKNFFEHQITMVVLHLTSAVLLLCAALNDAACQWPMGHNVSTTRSVRLIIVEVQIFHFQPTLPKILKQDSSVLVHLPFKGEQAHDQSMQGDLHHAPCNIKHCF